jgi:hypothetical protein
MRNDGVIGADERTPITPLAVGPIGSADTPLPSIHSA